MPDSTASLASFNTTQWTLIGRAVHGDARTVELALGELFLRYMPALRAYLVGAKHMRRDEADEAIQSFLTSKILEQGILERAHPNRGKFRNFLLVSLNRFLVSRARYELAGKRSPGTSTEPIPAQADLADSAPPPDAMFDIEWARQLLADAVRRMKDQCEEGPAGHAQWLVFEERVLKPALENGTPMEYEQLVRRLGCASPREVQNVLVNAKRRFVTCLRLAVADYEG